MTVVMKPANTNTGPSTINVSLLGNIAINTASGGALVGGELVAGTTYLLVFDGTAFRIISPSALAYLAGVLNGKNSLLASSLKWSTSFFPTMTGTATVDCTGLSIISVRMTATSGAAQLLTLNNVQQGAAVFLSLGNTTGVTVTLKITGTDQNGTTLAGTVTTVGGASGDLVASGISQANGFTLALIGSLINVAGTPTLETVGIR